MSTQPSNRVLSTTLSLILLQVSSRLLSFGLNQALLRSTSPEAFGLATIKFDTLIGTVLFLLREGIRGAVVRVRSSSSAVNSDPSARLRAQTLSLPLYLTPLALLSFTVYSSFSTPTPPPPHFTLTLTFYFLSTLIELLFEPLYLHTLQQWESLTTGRVRVEGMAVMVKALVTLAAVKTLAKDEGLLAFGLGQLAYSSTIWVGLATLVSRAQAAAPSSTSISDRAEKAGDKAGWGLQRIEGLYFDPQITGLGWALTKQSVVKQLLTEGDKLAVGRFGSGQDMGGYAVALNYGSLIARLLFQPLEESSRLYFSTLSTPTPSLPTLILASTYLRLLLLLQTHLTLLFIFLAPSYTTPLLHLLLGPTWSTTAGPILRAYAFSLPFMGLNGLTEAFFQSTASEKWIRRGSGWMCVCAVAFAGTVATLCGDGGEGGGRGMGAKGLIVANCVNLALRTGFSSVFIWTFFESALSEVGKGQGSEGQEQKEEEKRKVREQLIWKAWTPNVATTLAFGIAGWVVRESEGKWEAEAGYKGLRATVQHLGVGAAVGLGCLGIVFLTRRHELQNLVKAMKGAKTEPTKEKRSE
ncbi:hypothetical protein JCM11641_003397 [Rhodosporidiobolus odoratus]